MSASSGGGGGGRKDEMDYTPLWMSLIAGLSTCLGAAWVLLQRNNSRKRQYNNHINTHNKSAAAAAAVPVIPPSTMCFSLALAGSVMVTVSVVSIIPECLREEIDDTTVTTAAAATAVAAATGYRMIPLSSRTFLFRVFFHALGYFLYFLLARYAFPSEPEELLQETFLALDHNSHCSHSSSSNNNIITTSAAGLSKDDSFSDVEHLLLGTVGGVGEQRQSIFKKKFVETTNARNRRTTATSFDSATDIDNDNNNTSNGSYTYYQDTVIGNGNDKDKQGDFLKRLSRCSSGADLDNHEDRRAWRVAMLLFLSLSAHNFPEGLAVAASVMESKELGLKVTIGIMIHNLPEGVAIAVPCLAARPDRPWLAFWLSALSGLFEPLGAFVALFALRKIDNNSNEKGSEIVNMENVLAFVAGIMIMVAVAELFPEALRHTQDGKFHFVAGTVAGIIVMVATEVYLA